MTGRPLSRQEGWVVVVVDDRGVDGVIGPFSTRKEAQYEWQRVQRSRDISAYAAYRQLIAPGELKAP